MLQMHKKEAGLQSKEKESSPLRGNSEMDVPPVLTESGNHFIVKKNVIELDLPSHDAGEPPKFTSKSQQIADFLRNEAQSGRITDEGL